MSLCTASELPSNCRCLQEPNLHSLWWCFTSAQLICSLASHRMDWTDIHYRQLARLITKHTFLYTEMVVDSTLIHNPHTDRCGAALTLSAALSSGARVKPVHWLSNRQQVHTP